MSLQQEPLHDESCLCPGAPIPDTAHIVEVRGTGSRFLRNGFDVVLVRDEDRVVDLLKTASLGKFANSFPLVSHNTGRHMAIDERRTIFLLTILDSLAR